MIRSFWTYGPLMMMLSLFSCNKKQTPLFEVHSAIQSGLSFENKLKPSDSLNILDYLYYYNGGGAAMGDINNDGLPDLYFSANQGPNTLYLNQGDMKFKDITLQAGVQGFSDWQTGCLMFDANKDGLMDLYVQAVVGLNGFKGHNELYINNGDLTFTESSAAFGLNLQDYGTMSALIDYDQDGDLDLYILNHAVHTQESFGKVDLRYTRHAKTGDRLMRNDGNEFVDVSEQAGILGGVNAYGLGVSVADLDKDGWPDVYVGNDFHEDDYYYHNNQDGTFTEQLRERFSHTSRFSMGNDVGDINNDGWPDLISLDMLPESEKLLKTSEGDDAVQTLLLRTKAYGYHYQYSRNMLFVNQNGRNFSETALYSDVAATDWSWSALFGDYDLDGHLDLFISNGITRRPNNLDYIKYISNQEIHRQINDGRLVDQTAIERMPSGAAENYFFKGQSGIGFKDVSSTWNDSKPSLSGASVVGDLDRDGDLDIVTNNTDSPVSLYVNQRIKSVKDSRIEATTHIPGLSISLKYLPENPYGLGTKAYLYQQDGLQYRELYPVRGFQSSSEPLIHFHLPDSEQFKGLKIVWPNGDQQWVKSKPKGGSILISYEPSSPMDHIELDTESAATRSLKFIKQKDGLGIDFIHREDEFSDFNTQKLIPYKASDHGPAYLAHDFDNDGQKDLLISGGKGQATKIYLSQNNGYQSVEPFSSIQDSLSEFVDAAIYRSQGSDRLVMVAAGNSVRPSAKVFENRVWTLSNLEGQGEILKGMTANTHVVRGEDELLFIGNFSLPQDFGQIPESYVFREGEIWHTFENLGMVTDAIWLDHNKDGLMDLFVIGHWMAPRMFVQTQSGFKEHKTSLPMTHGLWQRAELYDIDQDGDMDILLGNWGLNSKLKASPEHPMKLWYHDFDQNGVRETILTTFHQNGDYPLLGLDDLAAQMVMLRKNYTQYDDFAQTPIESIQGLELDQADVLIVNELSSGYLENNGERYHFVPFDFQLQLGPIHEFLVADFDLDQQSEVLVGGNYFGVIPFHGRFDSFSGILLETNGTIIPTADLGLDFWNKSVRHLDLIKFKKQNYLIAIYNNEAIEIFQIQP